MPYGVALIYFLCSPVSDTFECMLRLHCSLAFLYIMVSIREVTECWSHTDKSGKLHMFTKLFLVHWNINYSLYKIKFKTNILFLISEVIIQTNSTIIASISTSDHRFCDICCYWKNRVRSYLTTPHGYSSISQPASFFNDTSEEFQNLILSDGQFMQLWVEYSGLEKQINVTLAPLKIGKPKKPLLSCTMNVI